jgi:hypothetical protein
VTDSSQSGESRSSTGHSEIWRACGTLAAVVVAVWPLFAVVGYARSGVTGIWAAVVAAGICGAGAAAGLVAAGAFRNGPLAVHGVLLAMLPRMGAPLAGCLFFVWRGGALHDAGVVLMILTYYLITLAVETWLLLRVMKRREDGQSVSKVS